MFQKNLSLIVVVVIVKSISNIFFVAVITQLIINNMLIQSIYKFSKEAAISSNSCLASAY